MSDKNTEVRRGEWIAVIVGEWGRAFRDVEQARTQCEPDQAVQVVIGRDSALPVPRDGRPGEYQPLVIVGGDQVHIGWTSPSASNFHAVVASAQARAAELNDAIR
ncbi:hypothetical protein E1091_02335 [Micromonospora fluostatini]|uniref:Uncharacterized protein n=1 Tax=Micromonospora fluostatini TaxID=1629071 RepID=A0ABY2DL17_9ACTN|nr:hypothetical protein E1091_02335 [Micromonospora fluostatini]